MKCPESEHGEEHCFCNLGPNPKCCFCRNSKLKIEADEEVRISLCGSKVIHDYDDDGSEENIDYAPTD